MMFLGSRPDDSALGGRAHAWRGVVDVGRRPHGRGRVVAAHGVLTAHHGTGRRAGALQQK